MALGLIPVENYRTKLYQKGNSSNKFESMSEEELAIVAKKIYERQEIPSIKRNYNAERSPKLEHYIKTLKYLINPDIHMELPEYDQRIAYLIMAVDPYLITFKDFLKIHIQSIDEIAKKQDKKKRNQLFDERNKAINKYECTVRDQLGFFDVRLLKYEELFFKRFYNKRELITEVGIHNEDSFILLSLLVSSFDSISDARYQELQRKANIWLSQVPSKYKTKIATYSVQNQKELIGLKSPEEQLVFFILVVDPNLDMLKIYEEESMIGPTKERILEQFGYYSKALISFEKLYHRRFCPTKILSPWTDIKKY